MVPLQPSFLSSVFRLLLTSHRVAALKHPTPLVRAVNFLSRLASPVSRTLCICAFALECEIFHSIFAGIVSPSQAVVVLAVPSQDNSASMS